MAKRTHHKRPGMTIPVAVIAGFAPLAIGEFHGLQRIMAGDRAGGTQEMVIRATGYNTDNHSFNSAVFMETYGPMLAGFLVHKIAGKLGVNRALSKAGVPLIRI
jgi:hypothetical protein